MPRQVHANERWTRRASGAPALRRTRCDEAMMTMVKLDVATLERAVWHGWTGLANADAYERLLRDEVFRGISARAIAGYDGIELLRRVAGDEVEFVAMMWFETLTAVRTIAGPEYEQAVVRAAARELLTRFDERSAHYDVEIPRTSRTGATSRPAI